MKVWSTILHADHRYGFPGTVRQVRGVVATKSKAAAARAFGITIYEFNQHGSETGNEGDIAAALAQPGVALVRPLDHRGDGGWIKARDV